MRRLLKVNSVMVIVYSSANDTTSIYRSVMKPEGKVENFQEIRLVPAGLLVRM